MKRVVLSFVLLVLLTVLGVPGCNGNGGGSSGGNGYAPPPPTPASFSVSNLFIEPSEAEPNEIVTVSVSVANTGGTQGSYDVVLTIDGEPIVKPT